MTPAGYVQVADTIDATETDIFDQDPINPFINVELEQLSFNSVLVQNNQIFVSSY